MIAATGKTYTVPTLAVAIKLLTTETRRECGKSIDKIKGMIDQMLSSITGLPPGQVKIGMGTDLFGVEWPFAIKRVSIPLRS